MKKYLIKNQKGFSLIEALVAMVILTVGLLAVGLMQIGAMKGNSNAIGRSDGAAIAQSAMDTLRTLPLNPPVATHPLSGGADLDAGATNPDGAGAGHFGSEIFASDTVVGANGQTYTIFWNVRDDIPVTSAKTVRVFVYWTDPKFGQNRAIMTSVLGGLYL